MSNIGAALRSFSDLVSLKPVGEEEIANAEKQLNLKFAPDYKEYTSEFGAAAANGHELTGAVTAKRLDVVAVTKYEWERNPQVPHSLYVVENAGIDGIIIWQDETGKVFQSAPGSEAAVIAASLKDYITAQ